VPDNFPATDGARPADDPFAAALRGFGPVGLLAILIILAGNAIVAPLSAVLVLLWAHRSRTPWREIGLARPRSWIGGLALGLAFGIAFKLAMKALVMPLLGADPVNQAYHHLAGNRAALPGMLFSIVIGAGFGEEIVWRGWMFERLGRLLGQGTGARAATVVLTAILFGLAHYPEQGLPAVQQGAIVGLAFGAIFAVTGRLWMLVCAHIAFDLTALALIYWDVETPVAHALLG
jgi:membrane protease YdiL (CAAX protease family)